MLRETEIDPDPPLVAVVVPCWNLGAYLDEAIGSALASTHPHVEVVLVDDGSTDAATIEVIDRLGAAPRVRMLRQENQGLSAARNNGIRATAATYILPLDADNRLGPTYIERGLEVMRNRRDVGIVHGAFRRFGDREGVEVARPFALREMLRKNRIDACALVRRQAWEDVGGYDPAFQEGYEDWDFWLSAYEKGWKFEAVEDVLFDYRVRNGSMTARCDQPAVRRAIVERLTRKHRDLYLTEWSELWVEREMELLAVELAELASQRELAELRGRLDGAAGALAEREARIRNLQEELEGAQAVLSDLRPAVWLRAKLSNTRVSRALKALIRRP